MKSHHGIMIPYKPIKRKVEDVQGDDGIIVMKTFKRYDNTLSLKILVV